MAVTDIPLLRGTKGIILRILRRGERTVDELASPLELTPNAVRSHLAELGRDGLVQQRSVRRGPRKPSIGFSLTERGDALFPKRYDQLLNAVLDEIRAGGVGSGVESAQGLVTAVTMEALFRRIGQRLAADHAPRLAALPPAERLNEALRIIGELGGEATLTRDPDQPHRALIIGQSCPFKAIVPEHPEVCAMLEAFLAEVLPEDEVCEACQKEGLPHCRFEVLEGLPR